MKKNFILFATILAIATLLISCGGEQADTSTDMAADAAAESYEPPTAEEAAAIIQKAPAYSDFRFTSVTLSIPMQESEMHDQMKAYVRELEQAGWVRLDSTGTLVLADKARQDNRWVERPGGFVDIAPLARKEFVEVTSVEKVDDDEVEVDFTYRWEPNTTGQALQSGLLHETLHSEHYATATLENYGDGWEVFIIRPAEPPAEESEESGGAEE